MGIKALSFFKVKSKFYEADCFERILNDLNQNQLIDS